MEAAMPDVGHPTCTAEVLAEKPSDAAWRMLRVGRDRYDLIVVGPRDSAVWMQTFWTSEFFRLTRRRLAEGGVAAVVVRLSTAASVDLVTLTATFAAAFPEGGCVVARLGGCDVLVLAGCRGDGEQIAWERLARTRPVCVGGYDAVLVSGGPVEIHSLCQPRLRGKGAATTADGLLSGGVWRRMEPGDSP
jgi:hypothetical protein